MVKAIVYISGEPQQEKEFKTFSEAFTYYEEECGREIDWYERKTKKIILDSGHPLKYVVLKKI